ncbi:MAG: hypothetical protein AAGK93_01865 [Pseudomonadota bacterium]
MNYDVMALMERKKFGSPTRKQVMVMMAMHINDPLLTDVWPSAVRLGLRCEISEKTVRRTWIDFEKEGLIKQVGEKSIRGGKVKIWRINLRAVQGLENCIPTLEEQLGELPDNLSSGNATTGHSLPEPPDTEAQNHRTQCPTNSPKEESNGKVQRHTSDLNFRTLLESFWESAPKPARVRSSKNDLAKAIKSIPASIDPEAVLKAWKRYLLSPDAVKDDGKFVPGIHRWIKSGKYDAWLEAETDLFAENKLSDLERCFESVGKTGHWPGDRFGWPHPHSPKASYPAELYERFNVERRAA